MTLLTDPMGTSDPDWGRREPRLEETSAGSDAEALEIVQKFETRYAELAPAVEPQQRAQTTIDDAFRDVSLDIGGDRVEDPRPSESRTRPPETRRAKQHRPSSFAGSVPLRAAADSTDDMALDEAMAILRSVERKDGTVARAPLDAEEPAAARRAPGLPPTAPGMSAAAASPQIRAREPSARVPEERGHSILPRIAAAAALALAVGVGVGYLAAQLGDQQAMATETSDAQGGAGLRIDYELRKR